MKLEADARIAFPRAVVWSAYRDRMPELVPHLPNIRAIRVESREEGVGGDPARVDMVNIWEAKADIPKIIQGIVRPDALSWVDRASWHEEVWACEWSIEPRVFAENVRCGGQNRYRLDGDDTILEIRGELEVDPSRIPGVPKLLAAKMAPAIERFVVNLIRPNLLSVADGLERFLAEERARAP